MRYCTWKSGKDALKVGPPWQSVIKAIKFPALLNVPDHKQNPETFWGSILTTENLPCAAVPPASSPKLSTGAS